jgi:hypothetical protein
MEALIVLVVIIFAVLCVLAFKYWQATLVLILLLMGPIGWIILLLISIDNNTRYRRY